MRMTTPFDEVVEEIKKRGYHNHRLEEHSDTVSVGIFNDLLKTCPALREDVDSGKVRYWLNIPAPGARHRKIDLLVGQAITATNEPDLEKLRICVENKSVVTAHRNRDARFDDLNETLKVIYDVKPEAVIVATVMIGIAERTLNVPDVIKRKYKKTGRLKEFETEIVPRFSRGDQSLWEEFQEAISENKPSHPQKTLEKFRGLRQRAPGYTHIPGYDFILFVPVFIDNVNVPYVARQNSLGIDIDKQYSAMLDAICKAYKTRWHL